MHGCVAGVCVRGSVVSMALIPYCPAGAGAVAGPSPHLSQPPSSPLPSPPLLPPSLFPSPLSSPSLPPSPSPPPKGVPRDTALAAMIANLNAMALSTTPMAFDAARDYLYQVGGRGGGARGLTRDYIPLIEGGGRRAHGANR